MGRCAIGKGGGKPSAGYCARVCRLNGAIPSPETAKPRSRMVALTVEQQALVDARKPICAACEHHKASYVAAVACGKCGCGGISLLRGKCPDAKW